MLDSIAFGSSSQVVYSGSGSAQGPACSLPASAGQQAAGMQLSACSVAEALAPAAAAQQDQLPRWQHTLFAILPGIMGGTARVIVGQPFETIKTRLQVMGVGTAMAQHLPPTHLYHGSWDCFKKVLKHEGPKSFYKGTSAPLVGNMALLGVHFPVFQATQKWIKEQRGTQGHNYLDNYLAGAAAGVVGSLVSCPAEHIRTRVQLTQVPIPAEALGGGAAARASYTGAWDCVTQTLRRHGVKGLYRGYTSTLVRDTKGFGFFFMGYEATLHAMAPGKARSELNYAQVMAAGIAAGLSLWGSMFHIDTVKSKLQADSLELPQYKNTADCVRQTVAVEGTRGLFRGFWACLARGVPVNAAIFLAVEATRNAIADYEHQAPDVCEADAQEAAMAAQ